MHFDKVVQEIRLQKKLVRLCHFHYSQQLEVDINGVKENSTHNNNGILVGEEAHNVQDNHEKFDVFALISDGKLVFGSFAADTSIRAAIIRMYFIKTNQA